MKDVNCAVDTQRKRGATANARRLSQDSNDLNMLKTQVKLTR